MFLQSLFQLWNCPVDIRFHLFSYIFDFVFNGLILLTEITVDLFYRFLHFIGAGIPNLFLKIKALFKYFFFEIKFAHSMILDFHQFLCEYFAELVIFLNLHEIIVTLRLNLLSILFHFLCNKVKPFYTWVSLVAKQSHY